VREAVGEVALELELALESESEVWRRGGLKVKKKRREAREIIRKLGGDEEKRRGKRR